MKVYLNDWCFGFLDGDNNKFKEAENKIIERYLNCILQADGHFGLNLDRNGNVRFAMCTNNDELWESSNFNVCTDLVEMLLDGVNLMSELEERENMKHLKLALLEVVNYIEGKE